MLELFFTVLILGFTMVGLNQVMLIWLSHGLTKPKSKAF